MSKKLNTWLLALPLMALVVLLGCNQPSEPVPYPETPITIQIVEVREEPTAKPPTFTTAEVQEAVNQAIGGESYKVVQNGARFDISLAGESTGYLVPKRGGSEIHWFAGRDHENIKLDTSEVKELTSEQLAELSDEDRQLYENLAALDKAVVDNEPVFILIKGDQSWFIDPASPAMRAINALAKLLEKAAKTKE